MSEGSIENRKFFKEWLIWIALFILPLIFYPVIVRSNWASNSDVHSLLEFWAAGAGLTAAGIVLIHFFATGRRFFLLISLGFTLQSTADLFHGIYSFSRIWPVDRTGLTNLVAGTNVTGRLVLIICIFLALYLGRRITPRKRRMEEAVVYNTTGFLLAAIVTGIAVDSPLPRFVYPGRAISQPIDFIAALLYLAAFFVFVKIFREKENRTPFTWSMVASVIFGFITQVYMVHSQQLYDAQFTISHFMKILSYIFPVFGIALGTLSMYNREAELAKQLGESVEREKGIAARAAATDVERQKSRELERALKDAKENRNIAENAKVEAEQKALELEKVNKFMLGREQRMAELKREIIELKKRPGE